jgi:hypothetical protein
MFSGSYCRIGLFLLAFLTISCELFAQPRSIPDPICKSIEDYVALVDSAKSISDSKSRHQMYASARSQLDSVLKGPNYEKLLKEALEYTSLTEAVVTKDATDPQLTTALSNRSQRREYLLQICMGEVLRK